MQSIELVQISNLQNLSFMLILEYKVFWGPDFVWFRVHKHLHLENIV
jgi:hypothetical protein